MESDAYGLVSVRVRVATERLELVGDHSALEALKRPRRTMGLGVAAERLGALSRWLAQDLSETPTPH